MGDVTKISWTDHTFNPVRGCTKISPGCVNCYAEVMSGRNPSVLGEWGPSGKRAFAAEAYWLKPVRWNEDAWTAGERRRVFCASLGDVFEDRDVYDEMRHRLFHLILTTPWLDWQLLTKRPHVALRWAREFGWPSNAWAGPTVENQEAADERIPILAQIPARVRFVSYEPAIGPVKWDDFIHRYQAPEVMPFHWLIVGGESGKNARPFEVSWARDALALRGLCKVFVKQLGYRATDPKIGIAGKGLAVGDDAAPLNLRLEDGKGGDTAEWPEYLRVREFPSEVKSG